MSKTISLNDYLQQVPEHRIFVIAWAVACWRGLLRAVKAIRGFHFCKEVVLFEGKGKITVQSHTFGVPSGQPFKISATTYIVCCPRCMKSRCYVKSAIGKTHYSLQDFFDVSPWVKEVYEKALAKLVAKKLQEGSY
jgi:hypothetical protein